ncbi:MAG TPA: TetR/AcrR family transcriptional regulator [Solirubrobacteraceae bacterium]
MSPRPKLDHIRRPQLLAAAAEVIQERGFHDARISDIAERVGIHASTVLHYVKSKDALLREALTSSEEALHDELMEELRREDDAVRQLLIVIDWCSTPPGGLNDWALWIEIWQLARINPDVRDARVELDARWRNVLADIVRKGQQDGQFGDDLDPDDVAVLLASLFDGLALQVALADPNVSAERMRRLSVAATSAIVKHDLERPRAGRSPKR